MRLLERCCLLLAPLVLAGCFFENPLTSSSSESLNTWLLGEWRHEAAGGGISKMLVTPAASDRYLVQAEIRKPRAAVAILEFDAWASRVGGRTFFTLRSRVPGGEVPEGGHVFAHIELLDQQTMRVRSLELPAESGATSMELRRAVRRALKDGTLFSGEGSTDWERVAEVYWKRDGEVGTFTPLRTPPRGEPSGTTP